MAKPTKTEIRDFLRRIREDMQKLSLALTANKPRQIAVYLNDMEGSIAEVRELIQERYGPSFEAAEEELFGPEEGPEE